MADELCDGGKGELDTADNDSTSKSSLPCATHVHCKVIVYASLSGIVSFFPDGRIHGCNHHFSVMLFGYSQQELVDKVRGYFSTTLVSLYNHYTVCCIIKKVQL